MAAATSRIGVIAGAGALLAAGAGYLYRSTSVSHKERKAFIETYDDPAKIQQALNEAFPGFVAAFVDHARTKYNLKDDALARVERLIKYTCVGGKMWRASLAVQTVRDLCRVSNLDFKERLQPALVLGWCTEILQACFLVADDIMDGSETRRGQPCWHTLADVKLDAINDTLILESFLYFLLKTHLRNWSCYTSLLELYHEVSFQTQMGQMLDLSSQPQGRVGPDVLRGFNLDLYKQIVHYKTAFYTFYLPIASGMLICGYNTTEQLKIAYDLSVELGEKFQIEDDFLDCYGDPQVIGKIGTDIQDHKCSWLLVQAMLRATPEQYKLIENNLGKKDEASVQRIKQLYRDLNIEQVFQQQEKDSYERIAEKLKKTDRIVPSCIFKVILDKIHNRKK